MEAHNRDDPFRGQHDGGPVGVAERETLPRQRNVLLAVSAVNPGGGTPWIARRDGGDPGTGYGNYRGTGYLFAGLQRTLAAAISDAYTLVGRTGAGGVDQRKGRRRAAIIGRRGARAADSGVD